MSTTTAKGADPAEWPAALRRWLAAVKDRFGDRIERAGQPCDPLTP